MKLLTPSELSRVDAHLGQLVDRFMSAEGLTGLRDAVRAFVLAGGKRIRPQLCLWTWQKVSSEQSAVGSEQSAVGGEQSAVSPALLDLACAWELFHAFLLAHDDIIDASDSRRDQPALHRRLASLDSDCPIFGRNLAIVAGDLLFTACFQLLHDIDLPDPAYRKVLKLFSQTASTTGFGQAVDICAAHTPLDDLSEETLLREYLWKTAAYTFEGPMLSGAIVAGASDSALGAVSRFALSLGQAYQLQNDIIDLRSPAHEGCDLVQGKRTVTLMRARSGMSTRRKRELDNTLDEIRRLTGADTRAITLAEILRRDLCEDGVVEKTGTIIDDLIDRAKCAADDPVLGTPLREGLHSILKALNQKYFVRA